MDLATLGRKVAPAIELIPRKLAQCTCATLCTADGFNLCSIGVTAEQLGKMAALTSSLISLGDAMQNTIGNANNEAVDVITLQSGDTSSVGIKVPLAQQGYLLMLVSAQGAPLGVILTIARNAALEVRKLLAEDLCQA
jgi:hypothetical protein